MGAITASLAAQNRVADRSGAGGANSACVGAIDIGLIDHNTHGSGDALPAVGAVQGFSIPLIVAVGALFQHALSMAELSVGDVVPAVFIAGVILKLKAFTSQSIVATAPR